ncbi:MAG: hypothetical protein M3275_00110 [Thermoproteota archaeon]|nr:hypothetical protein [Thermoproteota archaeon]
MTSSKLLTVKYNIAEGRTPLGWYEYHIDGGVKRYVPIYEESDRIRAANFWKMEFEQELE